MSKRPYFVITHVVDCDGYNTYVDYIGTNLQAALKRFRFLCDDIKERYFIQDGVEEERINYSTLPERDEDGLKEYIKQPGNCIRTNINDDCDCWISINLYNLETNHFTNYSTMGHDWDNPTIYTDNMDREALFKRQYPDSKY